MTSSHLAPQAPTTDHPVLIEAAEQADLGDIAAKVLAGERLDLDEGLRLFQTPHLGVVGALANVVRERLHGDVSWFNRNLHVNATNVCEASCIFCSFARLETGDPDAWTMTMKEATDRVRALDHALVTEVHVVNGLNPDLPYDYYPTLIRELRDTRPGIHVKGFTAVEIHYYAEKYGMSYEEVLRSMMEAGLGSMPGGGAEIFHPRARLKLCHDKVDADGWLEVHRVAHRLGMRTNCTMLFGSIETLEERVDHLIRLRELQDESLAAAGRDPEHMGGRFITFIPLRFHNDNNRLAAIASPTGAESLRTIAVSRLMLDNLEHIKAYWPMLGEDVAQLAQHFGSSDIDGTVHEEHIYHMAGAHTPQGLTRARLVQMVRDAQRVPAERDTVYNTVRRDDLVEHDLREPLPVGTETCRVGVVGYRNSIPLTRHLRGIFRRDGHPSEVARWLAEGEVDLALVPVVAMLEGRPWCVVPELCIGADGPVHSVLFAAETPPEEWTEVLLDGISRTSVILARLLLTTGPLRDRVRKDLRITDVAPGEGLARTGGTVASVVIGDAARNLPEHLSQRLDLGQLWKDWTGLPFVFAVWAGRADLAPSVVDHVRAAGLLGLHDLTDERYLSTLPAGDRTYLTEHIRYPLDDEAMMGLRRFAALAHRAGLVGRETFSLYPPRAYGPQSRAEGASTAPDPALRALLLAAASGEPLDWTHEQRQLIDRATTTELASTATLRCGDPSPGHSDEAVAFELAWPLPADPSDEDLARGRAWMEAVGTRDVVLTLGGWDGLDPQRLAELGQALGPNTRFLDLSAWRLDFDTDDHEVLLTDLRAWRAAGLVRLGLDQLWRFLDRSEAELADNALQAASQLGMPVCAIHTLGCDFLLDELHTLRHHTAGDGTLDLSWALRVDPSERLAAGGNKSSAAALRATALASLLLEGVRICASPAPRELGGTGLVTAQLALHAGARDFGTVALVQEPVVGKSRSWSPDATEAERAIRAAGRSRPARRSGDFADLDSARTRATPAGKPVRRAPSLA